MSFNSLAFAVYFPFVVACFFALPRRLCWGWLLLASYVFYAAYLPVFLLLLWTSTLVDYLAAKAIDGQPDVRKRRRWLVLSLLVNLGLLAGFKYGGFLSQTVSLVSTWMGGSPSRSRACMTICSQT